MKKARYEGASLGDKKAFAPYLAEDEELVIATGFGKNYMRHRFVYYILFPGGIFFLGVIAYAYFTKVENWGYPLLAGLILAIIAGLIKALLTYHSNRYLLTTRRVIIKKGYFSVKLVSALFDKITHIEVDQSLMDRMIMKHGTIIVNTAGSNKDELKIVFVDYPIEFKNMLERLINRQREQIGRATGPVVTVEGEVVEE